MYLFIYVCISVGLHYSCLLDEQIDMIQMAEDKPVCYSIRGFHELNSRFQYSASNKSPCPVSSWYPTTIFDPVFLLVKHSQYVSQVHIKFYDNILGARLIGLCHYI